MSERRRLRGTRSWQFARNSRCLKDVDLVYIYIYIYRYMYSHVEKKGQFGKDVRLLQYSVRLTQTNSGFESFACS